LLAYASDEKTEAYGTFSSSSFNLIAFVVFVRDLHLQQLNEITRPGSFIKKTTRAGAMVEKQQMIVGTGCLRVERSGAKAERPRDTKFEVPRIRDVFLTSISFGQRAHPMVMQQEFPIFVKKKKTWKEKSS